ncbi:proto-oncogene Mas-like [Tiliqua scincoides]|uniref:proto-oncogene Mas-like n=1 Tax=Tiliqua scincoides TaxID=71010 RepID=UPI003462905B
MADFSLTLPSPTSAEQENHEMDKSTLGASHCSWHFMKDIKLVVSVSFICVFGITGFVGNGAVVWLLGFRMKRTPVTTYILNLAVADCGVLFFVIPLAVFLLLESECKEIPFAMGWMLFHFMFSLSQFLLTFISIDRCVAVLSPIWYRCHRPEKLSTILCAVIWICCFLVHGIDYTLIVFELFLIDEILLYVFLMNAMVCLPLVTISTLILFIRFCFKSQQQQRGKLLLAILLALFFFLFLACPLNVMYLMKLHSLDSHSPINVHSISVGYLCASLNSCVNPIVYFLVGRTKKGLCAENLRLTLQRVFKQEENVHGEELQLSVQTQVPA